MTPEEILEGNRLIAEFMDKHRKYHSNEDVFIQSLKYDSSWDWLMPVVEKISKDKDISIRWYAGDCICDITKQSYGAEPISEHGGYDPFIMNVYMSVVKFIKWYNQQKLWDELKDFPNKAF